MMCSAAGGTISNSPAPLDTTTPILSLLSRTKGGTALAIRVYLSDILKERGMTAKELCAKVGITEANLSILRSGKASGVRFHTINKICYYLDCDVGDILRFDGRLEEDDEDEKT